MRNVSCYSTLFVEQYIGESANSSCNALSERLLELGESKIMCRSGVLHLNADQSRLCPGSTATEFMVLAPTGCNKDGDGDDSDDNDSISPPTPPTKMMMILMIIQ